MERPIQNLFLLSLSLIWRYALFGLVLFLALTFPTHAKRVALVIGNANYQHIKVLASPRNDALAMADALRRLGFNVLPPVLDADRTALIDAVHVLDARVVKGDEVVVYYSGHAVELNGINHLLPVDAPPPTQIRGMERLVEDALRLQRFLEVTSEKGARFTLAIFDACRDDPIQHVKGGGRTGLVPPPIANGQMVMFAAGWKQLAKDKLGPNDKHPNSLFTRVLLEELSKPGVSAREMAGAVRDRVASLAASVGHEQVPALYDQSLGNFMFSLAQSNSDTKAANELANAESAAWSVAKRANTVADLNVYLKAYPHGDHTSEARDAIGRLGSAALPAVDTTPPAAQSKREARKSPLPSSPGAERDISQPVLKQQPAHTGSPEATSLSGLQGSPAKRPTDWSQSDLDEWVSKMERIERALNPNVSAVPVGTVVNPAAPISGGPSAASSVGPQFTSPPATSAATNKSCLDEMENLERAWHSTKTDQERIEERAKKRKSLASAYQSGQEIKHCAECPEMVVVPAGCFEMSSPESGVVTDVERGRKVTVNIWLPFAIGKHEVTQGQWRAIMGSNPSHFIECGDDCPVEQVSWDDAKTYLMRLSAKAGKSYRLPTEAEWEYSCRAGGQHKYCGGDDPHAFGWYAQGHGNSSAGATHRVGGKRGNAWGLYDMSGNVWEWVEDCGDGNYGNSSDGSARTGILLCSFSGRVIRGGASNTSATLLNYTSRLVRAPNDRANVSVGFRVALTLWE